MEDEDRIMGEAKAIRKRWMEVLEAMELKEVNDDYPAIPVYQQHTHKTSAVSVLLGSSSIV